MWKRSWRRCRSQLEEANQQYRGAGEQIVALQQRVTQEEMARHAAEQALAQATILQEETQSYLQEERAALQQQLAQVTAEGQAKRVAVQEAEGKLLRLETELETSRSWLEEANQKYWGATEQVTALQQQLAQVTAEGQAKRVAVQEAEGKLLRLETELETSRSWLEAANQKYWGATEQVTALQQQLAQVTAEGQAKRVAVQEAEGKLLRLETELETSRSWLEEANQKYWGATEQVTALQQRVTQEETARQAAEQQLAQVTTEGQAKQVAAEEATKSLLRLEAELEGARSNLGESNQTYQGASEQVNELKQLVTQAETARQVTEEALTKTTTWLEQAKSRNRQLTTETIPELKNKLETQYSTVRDGRHALEQVRIELRETKKAFTETTKQLQKARQQIEAAGHQLEKTRATSISFRLGYLLIHNSKSANGLLRLPSALWALRKETLQRRKKKVFVPSPPQLSPVSKPSYIVSRPAALTDSLLQEQPSNGRMISADAASLSPAESISASASNRKLNIACIMDEFTFSSFQPEAILHQLTPSNWRAELEAAHPDLLFIESAWRGKEDLWGNKVGHTSTELQGIVEWCRTKHIPTVFWCKEDPVHFETFLNTAKLFDLCVHHGHRLYPSV